MNFILGIFLINMDRTFKYFFLARFYITLENNYVVIDTIKIRKLEF